MRELPISPERAEDIYWDAFYFVGLWHRAVTVQIDRVRAFLPDLVQNDAPAPDHRGDPQELIEFCYLAIALANLQRAVARYHDAAKANIGKGEGSGHRRSSTRYLKKAVDLLDDALPQVRDVRDVVSHLEDYGFGLGRRQRSGQPVRFQAELAGYELVIADADRALRLNLNFVATVIDQVTEHLIDATVDWE